MADAGNHQMLIWKHLPEDSNVPADVVLGQTDFTQNELNRGSLVQRDENNPPAQKGKKAYCTNNIPFA